MHADYRRCKNPAENKMNQLNRSCCGLPSAPHPSASKQQQLRVQEELLQMVSAVPHPGAHPALTPLCLSPGPFPPALRSCGSHAPFPSRQGRSGGRGDVNPPCRGPGASQAGFPWRREGTCDGPSVRSPVRVPRASAGSMRNPPSLLRAGTCWFVLRLHHRPQADRTVCIPLSSRCLLENQSPLHRRRAGGQGFPGKGMLRAGGQPCPEGRRVSSPSHGVIPKLQKSQLPALRPEQAGMCPPGSAQGSPCVTSEMQYPSIKL